MTDHYLEQWRRFWQQAKEDQHKADQERYEAAENARIEKVISAIDHVGERQHRENHQTNPRTERVSGWKIAEVLGLWAAAAVGLTAILVATHDADRQLGVIKGQVEAMKGQLAEMHAQSITTRAQIRANMAREAIVTHPVRENGNLTKFQVNPVWRNAGSTDAKLFRGWFETFYVPGTLKQGAADCPGLAEPNRLPDPVIIQPGRGVTEYSRELSMTDVTKVINNEGTIFIVGHAQYFDIFPDNPMHRLDWCVLVGPNDPERNSFSFVSMREETD